MMNRRQFLLATALLMGDAMSFVRADSKPIRMGYFEDYPPLSFRDAHGQMAGVLIDGMDLVGHAANLTFEHHGYPWARAQALVQSGILDGFCTNINLARQAYADFCHAPIVIQREGIYHRVNDKRMLDLHSIEDLRPFNQGSYLGNGYTMQYLEPSHIHWYKDEDTVLRMIDAGRLDVYVEAEIVTGLKLKMLGLTSRIQFTPAPFLPPAEFCFGLRRNYPNAAAVLAKVAAAARDLQQSGVLDTVFDKYR